MTTDTEASRKPNPTREADFDRDAQHAFTEALLPIVQELGRKHGISIAETIDALLVFACAYAGSHTKDGHELEIFAELPRMMARNCAQAAMAVLSPKDAADQIMSMLTEALKDPSETGEADHDQ